MSAVLNANVSKPFAPDTLVGLRAMAGKELKENAKWAILGLLGLSIAMAYTVGAKASQYGSGLEVWDSAQATLTLGGALLALALGLLQILPEQRRDLWAYLIHRPASRATIFWGKVIAGILLYLLATVPPLLCFAVWARTPGHIAAPFDWHLTLADWAAILSGLPFYFAGMLTGLRPARWWGSRAVPVPAAIVAAIFVLASHEFWQAVLWALGWTVVFAIAALGAFLTTGIYEMQPRPTRTTLGAVLYVGLLLTLGMIAGFVYIFWQTLFPAPRALPIYGKNYEITRAGQIVRVGFDKYRRIRYEDVHDLGGRPVRLPLNGKLIGLNFIPTSPLVEIGTLSQGDYPYNERLRYISDSFGQTQDEIWFYSQSARQCVDFSRRTRLSLGVLGPRGFVPANQNPADAGCFPGHMSEIAVGPSGNGEYVLTGLLKFPDALFLVTPELHTVHPVTLTTGAERAVTPLSLGDSNAVRFAVVTKEHFLILSVEGKLQVTIPNEHPSDYVDISMTPDGKRFFLWNSHPLPDNSQVAHSISEYDARGTFVHTYSLPPHPRAIKPPQKGRAFYGLLCPPVLALSNTQFFPERNHETFGINRQTEPRLWATFCALSALAGLISALLVWPIGRRCAYGRAGLLAWMFGAFWLGWPGVFLLLSLRDWPTRIPCPNCEKPRVVTRDLCEHCGAAFAPTPKDGTEIFEGENDRAEATMLLVAPLG